MSRIAGFLADLVAIGVFALLARIAHQSETMPLNVNGWLQTLWPFALGVVIVWALIAAFRWRGAAFAPAGVLAWVVIVVTGLTIWGIKHGAVPHWSFMLVASVSSAILLFGWRGFAVLFARNRGTAAA